MSNARPCSDTLSRFVDAMFADYESAMLLAALRIRGSHGHHFNV